MAEIGNGPRRIILNSHMDTVPSGDPQAWNSMPLSPVEKDGLVLGRGAVDAKGSLAAMIAAFEDLAKERPGLPVRVLFMAVGGEERGGIGTKAEVARGLAADAAIIGEPTNLIPMLAHKGVLKLEVEVSGKAAHASNPDAGVNAIVAMSSIISALNGLAQGVRHRSEKYTGKASLVISMISGGTAPNVVPDHCKITLDRRLLPGENEVDAENEITNVIEKAFPFTSKIKVSIRRVGIVPPALLNPEAPIIAAAERAVNDVLRRPLRATGFSAACDMAYLVNDAHIPTVIFGPGDLGIAHQADEHVELEQVFMAASIYKQIIVRWLGD